MSQPTRFTTLSLVACAALAITCSGTPDGRDQGHGKMSGYVWLGGPVKRARVHMTQLLVDGTPNATFDTETDDTGHWEITVGIYSYAFEITATGGSTSELATGEQITLASDYAIHGVVLDYAINEESQDISVSPVSELAYQLAHARLAAGRDADLIAAYRTANGAVGKHFLDTNVTRATYQLGTPASSASPELRAAIAVGSISLLAHRVAEASGFTAQQLGTRELLASWVNDITSSIPIDGKGANDALVTLGACTTRPELCQINQRHLRALVAETTAEFLQSDQNGTNLAWNDMAALIRAENANQDDVLFAPAPPVPFDESGPVIIWHSPTDGAQVSGSFAIDVSATDLTDVVSLTVTSDDGAVPADGDASPAHVAIAGLNSATLGEGTRTLRATAVDAENKTTTSEITVVVNNSPPGTLTGTVVLDRAANVPVKAYLWDGTTKTPFGSAVTLADGTFTLALGDGSGDIVIEAGGGGTYVEEARASAAVTVPLDSEILRTAIPGYTAGASATVTIDPLTEIAFSYASYISLRPDHAGLPFQKSWDEAVNALQSATGIPNITALTPAIPSSITAFNASAKAALVLAGISQRALQASTNGGGDAGAFGVAMASTTVTAKISLDVKDGCLDGRSGATQLYYGGSQAVGPEAIRRELANAIVAWLASPANVTPFTSQQDILPLLDTLVASGIATGPGSCSSGGVMDTDGSPKFDQEKPKLFWIGNTPADLALVRGTIMVQATGTDNLGPPAITWTKPIGLVDSDGDSTNANAEATINTAAQADGPLDIEATATDAATNFLKDTRHFTIDNTAPTVTLGLAAGGFVQVGSTYWTAQPKPTLSGTVSDLHAVTVTVKVNGAACGNATVSGTTWTRATAAWSCAALSQGPNAISVTATDAAGNVTTASGSLSYDATPPVLTFDTGTDEIVWDGRADTFTWNAAHAPTHVHAAAGAVNLGTASCAAPPAVYMFAYLLDQAAPKYGTDPDRNAIHWQFVASDDQGPLGSGIDASGTEYRLLAPGGAVLHDWSTVGELTAGSYTFDVPVYRNGITWPSTPALADTIGVFQIEFRATDVLGRQTTATRCWNHHPLAAPLHVLGGTAATTTPASNKIALTSLSLSAGAIDSLVLNDASPGTGLVEFAVYNGTAETVHATFDMTGGVPATPPTYSKTAVAKYIEVSYTPSVYQCPGIASPECGGLSTLPANPYTALSGGGMLSAPSYSLRVFDTTAGGATELQPCSGSACANTAFTKTFTVPARGTSVPIALTVVNVIKTIPELRPDTAAPYNRPSLVYYSPPSGTTTSSVTITGKKASSTVFRCDKPTYTQEVPPDSGNVIKYCPRLGAYTPYVALQQASLTFAGSQAFLTKVTGSPSSNTAPIAPIVPVTSSGFAAAAGWTTTQSPSLPTPIP